MDEFFWMLMALCITIAAVNTVRIIEHVKERRAAARRIEAYRSKDEV